MKKIILLKYGEMALKGLNKHHFEALLLKSLKAALSPFGGFDFYTAQSTAVLSLKDENADLDAVKSAVSKVFGIINFSFAYELQKDIKAIEEALPEAIGEELLRAKTFKVNAKRSDKKFPLKSPQICSHFGEFILNKYPHLSADMHNPDVTVTVEIRDNSAFLRCTEFEGACGMPTGSNGRGLLLISGGIDSPVAGYMMAKRGMWVDGIHFFSYPYTSELAKEKVITLCQKIAGYEQKLNLNIVPFTKIQEAIRDNCPEELSTIILRRSMMRIASRLALEYNCGCLISGESLGQVASQTLGAMICTEAEAKVPIFKPLIGLDKNEIVTIARKIDTFETSILPYEDCCTVFTPKHPKTNPKLDEIIEAEKAVDFVMLENEAYENIEFMKVLPEVYI